MDALASTVLALIAVLIAHLIEEVATGFRRALPVGEMPRPLFVGLNILICTYCFATPAAAVRGSPVAVPMDWVLAIGMLLNSLGHLTIIVVRRRYFPGGFTAGFLQLASGLVIIALLNRG
jgi:hypothetical protein